MQMKHFVFMILQLICCNLAYCLCPSGNSSASAPHTVYIKYTHWSNIHTMIYDLLPKLTLPDFHTDYT